METNSIPHIVVLSYNKENVKKFITYLENKFEFIEYYKNSDSFRIVFDNKNISQKNNDFVFKNVAKILLENKYYSANIIISSCIVKEKKKELLEKEINVKHILCESIIFLFENFDLQEKALVNENPFINYNDDYVEYIKNSSEGKIIKNDDFDLSNLYKNISIKISVFPLNLQKNNKEIINFFSEYFIECLYIDYESELSNETPEEANTKKLLYQSLQENKNNKFEEYYEEDHKRLVEVLHCHMWKGLATKMRNVVINNFYDYENKMNSTEKCTKSCAEAKENRTRNNYKDDASSKNDDGSKNDDVTEVKNTESLIQNFNNIVEKIRLAKIENNNCSDFVRRKKAGELVYELQQYFPDIEDE